MKTKLSAAAATLLVGLALAGCAGPSTAPIGGDVIAPVTVAANDLQGDTVDLVVGQTLNIDTGSLAVDSYTGEVSDASVATFEPGRVDGSAEFNPGVTALVAGKTTVTLSNEQGGIQPLEFTVVVSPRS
ncbi:hypothetical protein ACXR2W_03785 [Leucobacter sp. HY1908]